MMTLTRFDTDFFHGTWLPFDGDRLALRAKIQEWIRREIQDPEGRLEVRGDGPHWISQIPLHLSYSHTDGVAVVVYSRQSPIGVDTEKRDRPMTSPPAVLARRFFHPSESQLELTPALFFELWCKKEAYAKFTRLGLTRSLSVLMTPPPSGVHFESLPYTPIGYLAQVCIIKA